MRRRAGAAVLTALIGICLLAGAAVRATAREADLGSFRGLARASGQQYLFGAAAEGTVPDATAQLEPGIGYARAAVAWPGALVGNAGDLLVLASADRLGPAAEAVTMANTPARAEARHPSGPADASFDAVPGATLTAHAEDRRTRADAATPPTEVPGLATFGPSTSASTVGDGGSKVTARGESRVEGVRFAGGALVIDAVVSVAEATSDGRAGSGRASTRATGVTVGGQPAVLDEAGLRIGSDGQPVNDVANQIAQQALADAEVSVIVTRPSVQIDGASAVVVAGSIIIEALSGDGKHTFILGGAGASVSAAPAFDLGDPAIDPVVPVPVGGAVADEAPALLADLDAPIPAGDAVDVPASRPLRGEPVAFLRGTANPTWLAFAGLVLVVLATRALRRLADGVAGGGSPCDARGGNLP